MRKAVEKAPRSNELLVKGRSAEVNRPVTLISSVAPLPKVELPVTVKKVRVPEVAVPPPIITLSRVEVEIDNEVATPALEISQSSELMARLSPPSPKITTPFNEVWPFKVVPPETVNPAPKVEVAFTVRVSAAASPRVTLPLASMTAAKIVPEEKISFQAVP